VVQDGWLPAAVKASFQRQLQGDPLERPAKRRKEEPVGFPLPAQVWRKGSAKPVAGEDSDAVRRAEHRLRASKAERDKLRTRLKESKARMEACGASRERKRRLLQAFLTPAASTYVRKAPR